jgi:hypothetical protein
MYVPPTSSKILVHAPLPSFMTYHITQREQAGCSLSQAASSMVVAGSELQWLAIVALSCRMSLYKVTLFQEG